MTIPTRREVLDELIHLANEGKCPALMLQSLRDRHILAINSEENADVIADYSIRIIAQEYRTQKEENLRSLAKFADDDSLASRHRIEAVLRALIYADLYFDPVLASESISRLTWHSEALGSASLLYLRTLLVYHTTFGERGRALEVVQEILGRLPTPVLETEGRHARLYLAQCLLRLGHHERAERYARADWEFMDKEGQLYFAESFGSMAVDSLIAQGDFDAGRKLMARIEATLRRRVDSEQSHATIYYSAACALAQDVGDFERADRLMQDVSRLPEADFTPRVRGARIAQQLRTCRLRGDDMASQRSSVAELERLFEMGRCYGAQDLLAEELWHEHIRQGDHVGATNLLRRYLRARREAGAPEHSLMRATAADPAWRAYQAMTATCTESGSLTS